MDVITLPYCQLIGLKEAVIGEQKVISLTPEHHHLNHLGTIHAAVVFAVGEAGSAQAMAGAFPHLADQVAAVLRTASVKFRKPATSELHAVASIDEASQAEFIHRFERKGIAVLDVSVSVLQGREEILAGSYAWFISRIAS